MAIRKTTRAKRAEKDMTVYKVCDIKKGHDDCVYSWMGCSFKYMFGEKYNTRIKRTDDESALDEKESVAIQSHFTSVREMKASITHIGAGFHFSYSKERLEMLVLRDNEVLVECTIPKGSLYITGIDDRLGVAESIIINKIIY